MICGMVGDVGGRTPAYALACLTPAAMPAAFAITLAVIGALRPGAAAVPVWENLGY